jgi:hypothetical protein
VGVGEAEVFDGFGVAVVFLTVGLGAAAVA